MSASCSTTTTVFPWSRSCRRIAISLQVVARVQADRRLVEHVERVHQRRAERGRQVDALRFAARQRRRQPVQREVVEADVGEELQAPRDLGQHLARNRGVLLAEREVAEERAGLADGERGDAIDRLSTDAHVPRLAPQPRAVAVRARQVAAVAAQEHPDVHLVFLPFEPAEEPADAAVAGAVALDDQAALIVGQVAPTACRAGCPAAWPRASARPAPMR